MPSSIEDILAESDSDMSEDEGKAGNSQKKGGKTQKGRAWLKEGEEDDPLNFLDPKVSQRVLGNILTRGIQNHKNICLVEEFNIVFCCFPATNPTLKKSAKVDHGFKVTSDGRLIIKDDEEDVDDKGKRKLCHPFS